MTTHHQKNTPGYVSWQHMKARCLKPNNKEFPSYGGRGVTIYPPWIASFAEFIAYIGPRPEGTTLDRIKSDKGYVPGNVRWATRQEQNRNRSCAYRWHIKGRVFETRIDAAEAFKVLPQTISRWVHGETDKRKKRGTPRPDCYVTNR
jgi:hypothetical protein